MMITFAEYTSSVPNLTTFATLKKILNQPDTYEKLRLLEKKIKSYKGNKQSVVYRLAVYEYNKLKKIENKLLKEKKKRLYKKYKDDSEIASEMVSLDLSLEDLDKLVKDLYLSFTNDKKFKKKCKGLKIILPKFLSTFKAEGKTALYKKYYSVYIDVREFLVNNFSEEDL